MVNPIGGAPLKCSDELKTPPTSPHKPPPSPSKRVRTGSMINGLTVEHLSPHKSPRKVSDQMQQQLFEKSSLAKRDLTQAFSEAEVQIRAPVRRKPRPPNFNLAHQILQREISLVKPRINPQAWNQVATSLQLLQYQVATDESDVDGLEIDHLILRNWELATKGKDSQDIQKLLFNLAIKQIEMGKYNDLRLTCEGFLCNLEFQIRKELPFDKKCEVVTRRDISQQRPKDFIAALLMEGICALSIGNHREARVYFEEAIAKFRIFTQADEKSDHFLLINHAIQELLKALLIADGNTDLMLELFKLIYPMQCLICTLEERLATLQTHEEIKPGSTLLKQASIYFQLSSIEEALDTLEDALEIQDQISSVSFQELMNFGLELRAIWTEKRDNHLLELAIKYFDWAMKKPMQPGERSHALRMKYRTYRFLKNYTQALVARQLLEQLEPSNPAHLLLQAECCFRLGRPAQAVELLRRASEIRNEESTEITEQIVSDMLDLIPDTGYEDLVLEYTNWINDITQQMDD